MKRNFTFDFFSEIQVVDIINVIQLLCIKTIKKIEIIDIYQKNIKKKSITFKIILQSNNLSLSNNITNQISYNIIKIISIKLKGQIKKYK